MSSLSDDDHVQIENKEESSDDFTKLIVKRKLEDIQRFEGVTINTVNRWKRTGKVTVECFLGMGNNSSEADRVKGAEILESTGHFYCLVCDAYIRGNKKSMVRHQARNRRHVQQLLSLGANHIFATNSDNIPPFDLATALGHRRSEGESDGGNGQGRGSEFSLSGSQLYSPHFMTTNSSQDNASRQPRQQCDEAWEILNNPRKVEDVDKMNELILKFGICDGRDLLLCHLNEIEQFGFFLKKIPQRRFLQIFGITAAVDSVAAAPLAPLSSEA